MEGIKNYLLNFNKALKSVLGYGLHRATLSGRRLTLR